MGRSERKWLGIPSHLERKSRAALTESERPATESVAFCWLALVYLRAGGKSVQLPCATSAAMPILSPSVGCGWMVLPMSSVGADHAAAQDFAVAVGLG